MKKTALDFWVGLFVVLGFVALLFLALKAGNMSSLSFQQTYEVKLKFDNIGGLKARAPVKSAGVTVGRVGGIGFDSNTYQAVVTIDIDKQYQFPKDSSAKILTSGLLGEQYIGLEPGGDDQMLKNGDTHHDDAIGRGPRKPDRPVPLQQGGGFRRLEIIGSAGSACARTGFPGRGERDGRIGRGRGERRLGSGSIRRTACRRWGCGAQSSWRARSRSPAARR